MSLLNRSNQTLNINTFKSGVGINITNVSNTSESTCNVKISSNTSQKTSLEDDDILLLEDSGGNVKYITGAHLESHIDTNFWTFSTPNIYPKLTSENLLLGSTSNSNSRKLLVVGDSEIQDLYIQLNKKIISTNNSSDYLQFGDRTFTNNYLSNIFTYGISFGTTADLDLATGRAITRGQDSNDRITFNSGNFTFGNTGIFNNSVVVKSTNTNNSGNVSFFEANDNGTNNIDLHSPETLTHDYNVYLPQNTDTSLTSVYILSNKNVLGGTNINISNSTTDTITVNMDTTISGTITFSNTISGSISGNAGTATKIASITNSNIVQLTTSQVLTNKTITGTFTGSLTGNADTSTKIASITNSNIVQLTDTQVLSNKSFSDMPICEIGLAVKQTDSNVSGNIRFFDKDNSNYIDLHIEDHAVSGDYNVYLPNDIGETVLLGTRNTQTVINKTLSTGTIYNGNTIAVGYGGTGQASYVVGDLLYSSATATLSRLAIGSANTFLMSNGSAPVWALGYSFTSPLSISGLSVSLSGLSGFGSSSQIIATANDGSNDLQYRTLTQGTNITISHSSTAITISSSENYWENANTVGVLDIQPISSVNDIDLDAINLLVIPKTVNVIPTGLSSGKVIQYDSGLGGGNGSMVFGDNGSSASVNWDTGIYAKQFINMKCGTDTLLQLNNTPASVASATFTLNDINIDLGTNNGYSNIAYENCEPLMLFNKASSGTTHSHLVMKRDLSQTDFIILRQNNNDELLIHFENKGDRFEVNKNWEYGHAYAKWSYDGSAYTYFRNPSGTNSASSFAGSYFAFHNNGSVIFLNTTSGGATAGDYIGFSTGGVAKGRMSMDGNFKITGTITESHTFCDERVKENIKDYDTNAIELLNKLKIKSFNRKTFDNLKAGEDGILLPFSQRFSDKSYYDIGLIAQDILTEVPELEFLVENQDGGDIEPMTIPSWSPLTAICIKGIQQQQEEINTLKTQLENIKSILLKNNIS